MNKFTFTAILSLVSVYATAQVTEPEPFRKYQLISSEGFACEYSDEKNRLILAESDEYNDKQALEFVKTEDDTTYYIKVKATDEYVTKSTSNAWDITCTSTLPAELSRAKYQIEQSDSTGYVFLKNMHAGTYVGFRNNASEIGYAVYLNLTMAEHINGTVKILWKFEQLPSDAETLYYEECEKLIQYSEELADYPGIQNDISDFMMYVDDKAFQAESPDDSLYFECISEIQDYMLKIKEGVVYIQDIYNLYDECEADFSSTEMYPGIDDLVNVYSEVQNVFDSGEATCLQDYIDAYDNLKQGLVTYYDSQIPFATEEKPADMTYRIKYPNFRKEYSYSPESKVTSEGWISQATGLPSGYVNIAAQHKYAAETGRDVTCFAAWSWTYSTMQVYQDIDSLPEGRYRIECEGFAPDGKVYKQQAYITSSGVTEVDTADVAKMPLWQTFKTSAVNVINGKARIGFSTVSPQSGVDNGWFLVTNFKLMYCGKIDEEEIKKIYNEKIAECSARLDTMVFKNDRKELSDSISKYENVSGIENMAEAIEMLSLANDKAQLSVNKQVVVLNNSLYSALKDSISTGAYTGIYAEMASGFINGMENAINAEDATYKEMDSLLLILQRFRNVYVPTYSKAETMVVSDAEASAVLKDNMDRQSEVFKSITVLPSRDVIFKYEDELNKAMQECVISDIILSGTNDYTGAIINPGINSASRWTMPDGWNISIVGTGNGETVSSGQQVDGDKNGCYLSAWHGTPGHVLLNAYQNIENLPNGVYELRAMVRTTCDEGSYLYAIADNDSNTTVLKELTMERMNITELGGPSASDGNDSIATVSNMYGSIFADLYKRTNGGTLPTTPEEADTLNANNGKGCGWFYETLEVEVKNHALTIGFTNDSTFTMQFGGTPFRGTWLSADNFSLRMISEGNNDGWSPTVGIENVNPDLADDDFKVSVEDGRIFTDGLIYNINGIKVSSGTKVPSGIYIVKYGAKSKKLYVK